MCPEVGGFLGRGLRRCSVERLQVRTRCAWECDAHLTSSFAESARSRGGHGASSVPLQSTAPRRRLARRRGNRERLRHQLFLTHGTTSRQSKRELAVAALFL